MKAVDRILALDYGDRRIGIAVSDPLGITAQELETVKVVKDLHFLRIKEIIEEKQVKKILIGLPLNMNGSKGQRVVKTEKFAEKLKKYAGIPILMWDERLTSVEAKRSLIFLGQKTGKKKEKIDRLSAVLLLQSYLKSISDK